MRNPVSKASRILFLVLVASASVLLFVTSGRTSSSPLIISEFRFRGTNGANDEFIEIYNNSDVDHTVASSDGSSGYALAASDGVIRFVIPNGTIIPARGHYLGVNPIGYSLDLYPAGNGATANGDATYTTDIPDNAGVALFSSANVTNLTLGNRFDAAGFNAVSNTLYREGAGIPALVPFSIDCSLVRRDLTTFPSPAGTSDLRPRTSGTIVVPVSGGGTATIRGTTLEQPPSQPNGGGFNTSMSAGSVSFVTPVANGGTIDLQLLFGVQQEGAFHFCAVLETFPFSNSAVMCVSDDFIPPVLTSSLALTSLTQTNSDLVNVGLTASANEPATFTVQVFGDENDETPTSTTPVTVHSPDAKDIAVGTLRLRAERVDSEDGRVYLVVVRATDNSQNSSFACHTVVVPRKRKIDVDSQAAAAKSFCEANGGAPPPGYFVIGDGPIVGPKQ